MAHHSLSSTDCPPNGTGISNLPSNEGEQPDYPFNRGAPWHLFNRRYYLYPTTDSIKVSFSSRLLFGSAILAAETKSNR